MWHANRISLRLCRPWPASIARNPAPWLSLPRRKGRENERNPGRRRRASTLPVSENHERRRVSLSAEPKAKQLRGGTLRRRGGDSSSTETPKESKEKEKEKEKGRSHRENLSHWNASELRSLSCLFQIDFSAFSRRNHALFSVVSGTSTHQNPVERTSPEPACGALATYSRGNSKPGKTIHRHQAERTTTASMPS